MGRYVEGTDTFVVREADGRLKLDAGNPGWPEFDLVPVAADIFAVGRYEAERLAEIYFPASRVRFLFDVDGAVRLEVVRDEEALVSATRVP